MKIFVIDQTGKIQSQFLIAESNTAYYSDEIQALNAVELQLPELVLLDYALRGEDTAEYVDLLLSRSPSTSIVLIGDNLADDQVLACLLVGAKGYQNIEELAHYAGKIIRVVGAGEAWITRRMTARLLDAIRLQNLSLVNSLDLSSGHIESNISH